MSREEKGRHVKAQPARLDPDGKATPKTKLITHANPGHCRLGGGVNPGEVLEYQAEDGKRTAVNVVSASDRPHPYRSAADRTLSLFVPSPEERHYLASPSCRPRPPYPPGVGITYQPFLHCTCGWRPS